MPRARSVVKRVNPHPPHLQPALEDGADRLTIWTIWLLMAGALLREVLGQSQVAAVGRYDLHALDPACIFAIFAAAAHLAKGRLDWRPYTIPILIMAGLVAINFLRGIIVDPAAALFSMRTNASIAAILILAASMRPTDRIMQVARQALLLCCFGLGVLTLLRLATAPSLFMTVDVPDALINDGGRPLSAQGAFLMVLGSALLMSEFLQRRNFVVNTLSVSTVGLPCIALLTGQGTASVAAVLALAAVMILQPSRTRGKRILWGGIVAACALLILFAALPWLTENEFLIRRSNNMGTRTEVWESLMRLWPTLPFSTQLIGFPAGQNPPLLVYLSGGYRYWSLSIHSMYFGLLPVTGYLGALSFLAMMAILLVQTLNEGLRKVGSKSALPFAYILATAILAVSYDLRGEALIGLLVAIAVLRRPRADGSARSRSPHAPRQRLQITPPSPTRRARPR